MAWGALRRSFSLVFLEVLSQVFNGQVSIAEAEAQVSFESLGSFSEFQRRLHGAVSEDLETLASTAWLLAPAHQGRKNGDQVEDFDVLSLCDTGAQWYADDLGREELGLEGKLRVPLS